MDVRQEESRASSIQQGISWNLFLNAMKSLKISDLENESDVEQKFLYPFLVMEPPEGLGFDPSLVLTKKVLKIEEIEKGAKKKSYIPDCILVCRNLPWVIGEAKKPGQDLAEAAREARLYAMELNARYPAGINPCKYCLVTNGIITQLRAVDSESIIIEVLFEEMVSCTAGFTDLVSTIRHSTGVEKLKKDSDTLSHSPRYRPLSAIGGSSSQNDARPENSFGLILSSEFRSILNPLSLEDRVNIAKNAYVQTKRKERYIEDIDKLIRASTPPDIRDLKSVTDTENPIEIISKFQSIRKLESQILLLVGNVGAGKSTFIDYLREVALPKDVANKTIWLNVDLNHVPPSKDRMYQWCQDQLIKQFSKLPNNIDIETLEGLKKLFSNEYDKFKKGIGILLEGDPVTYNLKLYEKLNECLSDNTKWLNCLERYFCTARGKLLVIVLDNCDKRNRDTQLLMFEVARNLQAEFRALIVLPMRDTTYELHRSEPPLDAALKDLTFRIEPPLFQNVLTKRIDLILSELSRSTKDFEYYLEGKKVLFKRSDLAKYLKGMLSSLFGNERFARRMITGLAGWDMRQAMEIFIDLCKSGYVKENWIFDHQVLDKPFVLSEDIILNILMRTHRTFYDGDKSRIKNLYQIDKSSSSPCHFIRYWILLWLFERADKEGPSRIRGFHSYTHLIRDMVAIGLDKEDVIREANYLIGAKCIIPESQEEMQAEMDELIGLTPAGHVHVQLSKRITYLAGCAEDVFIFDEKLHDLAVSLMKKRRYNGYSTWTDTNQLAGRFAGYLHEYSQRWRTEQVTSVSAPEIDPPFDQIEKNADSEMQRIHARYQAKNNRANHNR